MRSRSEWQAFEESSLCQDGLANVLELGVFRPARSRGIRQCSLDSRRSATPASSEDWQGAYSRVEELFQELWKPLKSDVNGPICSTQAVQKCEQLVRWLVRNPRRFGSLTRLQRATLHLHIGFDVQMGGAG